MDNVKTTKITILKGSVGNTEWWAERDWEHHRELVEKLKATGEYLKPFEVTVSWVDFPEPFNSMGDNDKSLVSYSYVVIDTSNYESKIVYSNRKENGKTDI